VELIMKQLFRIHIAPNYPRLEIIQSSSYLSDFKEFDGTPKSQISPDSAFIMSEIPEYPWQQILSIAPGAFVFTEEAWEQCEEMYYIVELGCELLAAKNMKSDYRIVNPMSFAKATNRTETPFDLDNFYAPIFRMPDCRPTELFCLSGTDCPDGEFKHIYEKSQVSGCN